MGKVGRVYVPDNAARFTLAARARDSPRGFRLEPINLHPCRPGPLHVVCRETETLVDIQRMGGILIDRCWAIDAGPRQHLVQDGRRPYDHSWSSTRSQSRKNDSQCFAVSCLTVCYHNIAFSLGTLGRRHVPGKHRTPFGFVGAGRVDKC